MKNEEVTIGDCRLILGDCRDVLPTPSGNVAHLISAQAAEIEALRESLRSHGRNSGPDGWAGSSGGWDMESIALSIDRVRAAGLAAERLKPNTRERGRAALATMAGGV